MGKTKTDKKVTDDELKKEETDNTPPQENSKEKKDVKIDIKDYAKNDVKIVIDEVALLNEKLLRNYAEFDNFKKRTAKEKIELASYTKANCFKEILSVVDNFERALDCESKDEDFKKGMEMILIALKSALLAQGLVEIDALNKEFDPEFHNAINQVEDEKLETNTVCSVMQKGYMIGDKVVRHAMVVVVA